MFLCMQWQDKIGFSHWKKGCQNWAEGFVTNLNSVYIKIYLYKGKFWIAQNFKSLTFYTTFYGPNFFPSHLNIQFTKSLL